MDTRKIIEATAGRAANSLGLDVVQSGCVTKAGNGDKVDMVEVTIKLKGSRMNFIAATIKNGTGIVETFLEEIVSGDTIQRDVMVNFSKELGVMGVDLEELGERIDKRGFGEE